MILFDESHEEFCTVSGRKKRKPYTVWAEEVGDVEPCIQREGFLSLLGKSDALVIAEPHVYFSRKEVLGIIDFVENGGGLILIGNHSNTTRYYTYGCNEILNPLSTLFGMRFNFDEVLFSSENVVDEFVAHSIFEGISSVYYWRGCSLSLVRNDEAMLCAFACNGRSQIFSSKPAVACMNEKRVFALGDSSVWSNPRDFAGDNFKLARNVASWCAKA